MRATVNVSVVIEVELDTEATNDTEFIEQISKDNDVIDALAHMVAGALDYRKSSDHRKSHKIHFTRLSLEPRQIGWSSL